MNCAQPRENSDSLRAGKLEIEMPRQVSRIRKMGTSVADSNLGRIFLVVL